MYRLLRILLLSTCATPLCAQHALLLRDGNLVAVPVLGTPPQVLAALLQMPGPAERAQGLTTALPAGLRLLALREDRNAVTLRFDSRFLDLLGPAGGLEQALEQIDKTALAAGPYQAVRIEVQMPDGSVRSLDELTRSPMRPATIAPPPALPPHGIAGALSGRTIAVSPGHGYYWHSTLGWTTQRGLIDGLIEDIHTNEIAIRYLIPALENMGATVLSCRERGELPSEVLGNDDQGAPVYAESGGWASGTGAGWNGSGYRYAPTAVSASAAATFTLAVPRDGLHPVYVFHVAGSNRAPDARCTVHHRGGATSVRVDQTRDDRRWVHLGDFEFTRSAGARIVLDNQSALLGRIVVADAVRVGGGLGSVARGGRTSGRPRWQECARYWSQFAGAPSQVWDSISGGQDNDDDVTARPRYAEWRGADAFLSLHTNAGGGSGTDSFIYSGGATSGSAALQAAVQTQVVGDIRAEYDSTWVDRGSKSANFGEVRLLSTMPGVLVELAFHDTPDSRDVRALHDPRFRYFAGRALARGVMRYFQPSLPFPPEAPAALRVLQDGARGLRVAWEPVLGAVLYSIEVSADGKGFAEAAQTATTGWSTGPLPHGTVRSFRVRALNGSGRSFATEVLTAATSHLSRAELLLVQGFDRFDRQVKHPDNTRDYLRLHADAMRAHGEFSLAIDAASNEALRLGRVALQAYPAVAWALGEESTQHETFDTAEQGLVGQYLAQGGRLLVSGAELAWDLEAKGSSNDRTFLHTQLGVRYVADDAGTYAFQVDAGGVFAGLPAGSFDNGSNGTYDVDYPDVFGAADGKTAGALSYVPGGGVAATTRIDGAARVLCIGFPLETVVDAALRTQLAARALRFLLDRRELSAAPAAGLGKALPLPLDVPADASRPYLLAAALGLGAIPLWDGSILPLQPDPVFAYSLGAGNGVFIGFVGQLDATGRASPSLNVPNLPELRGLALYFSGLTVDSWLTAKIRRVLPWIRVTIA